MASSRTIGPIAHVSSLQGPVVTKKSSVLATGSVQIMRVTEPIGGVRGRERDNLPASLDAASGRGCRMGVLRFPVLFPFEAFFVPDRP